ncbi:hypothetical protein B0I35DRAFT_498344 [Stachybotrys elegans]|uniref:Uncharacterized protein n=1 Tax=Stachybotrys elegans TaxID=80388 RepID=A0A8K0SG30_9HYPO|nr:hypothetical protein B0I35DRAFT_498344 [Stachybotrys elegans]
MNTTGLCVVNGMPGISEISAISNYTYIVREPSTASKRLLWMLDGPLESAIQVAPGRYYDPDASLLEPQTTHLTVWIRCLSDWEELWVELNRGCIDTQGPLRPRYKDIRLEVTASSEFLTVHEYVSAVHPWLMDMRETIVYVLGKLDNDTTWPPETELAILHFGYGPLIIGKKEEWVWWHRKPVFAAPLSIAEREKHHQKVTEMMLARSAARIRELERRKQASQVSTMINKLDESRSMGMI